MSQKDVHYQKIIRELEAERDALKARVAELEGKR